VGGAASCSRRRRRLRSRLAARRSPCADQIVHNLEVYFDRSSARPSSSRRSSVAGGSPAAQPEPPPYWQALRGVAPARIRTCSTWSCSTPAYSCCTTSTGSCLSAAPTAARRSRSCQTRLLTGTLLIGAELGLDSEVQGAVLHTREPDGAGDTELTEAGIVGGKIGLNSAGLGLTINGLLTTSDDWSASGAAFHVRCYDILRQTSLTSAIAIIGSQPRACSANFLLARPRTRP